MANPLNLNSNGVSDDENEEITRDQTKGIPRDAQQEQNRDFEQVVNNNPNVDKDPSARRNSGARGYTERGNQKDRLENLHIGGSETSPQGGNEHDSAGELAQGPGYEAEGSYELDHHLRMREQKLGDDAPSGEPRLPQDGTSN